MKLSSNWFEEIEVKVTEIFLAYASPQVRITLTKQILCFVITGKHCVLTITSISEVKDYIFRLNSNQDSRNERGRNRYLQLNLIATFDKITKNIDFGAKCFIYCHRFNPYFR